jgi:hypothetical protein
MRSIRAASRVSSSASGFASAHCTPATTSRRLCGGMLVAIPTAIPELPFTSRFGNLLGNTSGSEDRPS